MFKKISLSVAMLLLTVAAFSQTRKITGTVADADGLPVIGAAVIVNGTTQGVATDINGYYELSVDKGVSVTVSSIGYLPAEFTVDERTVFDITLQEDVEMIEGTVVVGYGTVNRKNFTGSVSTYSVGEGPLANTSPRNAVEMLRGVATGLQMSQSGIAGQEPSLQIRGQKSINGGSQPLIVLDGVIFKGSINDLDPNTIESMSVMKDATSLASYGSQAANGVILITSKKGAIGKPTISFRGTVSAVEMNYKPDLKDGYEYVEMINARKGLEADNTSWMGELQLANYKAGEQTDWIDFASRTGFQQDYSLNVSGGMEKMNYLFGAGYASTQNFIKGNTFQRKTITIRINSEINKYISAGINFNWANTNNDGVRGSYSQYFSPWGEPYMEDGKTLRKYIIGPIQETATNPIWNTYIGRDQEDRGSSATLGGNIEVKIPWVKGLSYKITGNYTERGSVIRSFTHENNLVLPADTDYTTATTDKYLSQASGSITNRKNISYVIDNILTYNRELGDHYINATLVYTRDSDEVSGNADSASDFSAIGNTTLGFYGLNNAKTQTISSLTYSLHTDVGYLARANYSYRNKYHLNASFRRDGSSVFGKDHKWGNFPAVGAAWTISDEPWMKQIQWLDYLKIKASWGKNGNQSLSPYQTLSRMNLGKSGQIVSYFDDSAVFGESMSTLGNPDLGWETTVSWNVGWEADILDRRLHWELDAYKSKTTDQIFDRTIPVMGSGITNQQATMGRVDNWGIESSIRAQIVKGRDFNWNATLNFTMNRNKLVELYGDGQDDITNNLFIGKSLGALYGYRWIGIVQDTDTEYITANGAAAGDPMFANLDGSSDGKITADDMEVLGFGKEAFRMSLANTLTWKNISLYFMLNGNFSGGMYGLAYNDDEVRSMMQGMAYPNTVDHGWWTPENKSQEFTRASFSGSVYNTVPYGFVRLQDLNLSYQFNPGLLKKMGVSSLQVYVSGKNLFFIAPKWKYSDPEVRSIGSQQLQRVYTFGVNLRF